MLGTSIDQAGFERAVARAWSASPDAIVAVPVGLRLLADQLTPVVAYRRLVSADERTAHSFLFESVEGGERQGRHSILGTAPIVEIVARAERVELRDPSGLFAGAAPEDADDPLAVVQHLAGRLRLAAPDDGGALPGCFLGGWVGCAGYDSVRYVEPAKLPFAAAPVDDRSLPDVHLALYDAVVVFDHVDKLVHLVRLALVTPDDEPSAAWRSTIAGLEATETLLQQRSEPMRTARFVSAPPARIEASTLTRAAHAEVVERAREYIRAGDIFQVVLGQRFERRSAADPFDVYRALRVVNPSPYMVYLQAEGCILVASSPEILCRVRRDARGRSILTSRPLAGTRPRGATPELDAALEAELLADAKEIAEHVMLVDLGRNDVGSVCEPASVRLAALMEIERYSHVMHISSTVTGVLRGDLDCWDALRATLPVGTISGAPKIRAMQIIDELEPVRRGPYGGGFGYVGLDGQMDIALALRTIVVPTERRDADGWTYHLQASGGIVQDSRADAEYDETVNKAAAMARAIELAESAFDTAGRGSAAHDGTASPRVGAPTRGDVGSGG